MPLTDTQKAFIERYVLKRVRIGQDLAGASEGMDRTSPLPEDLTSAVRDLMKIIKDLAPPPGVSNAFQLALMQHHDTALKDLDTPYTAPGIRRAATEIDAMGRTHANAIAEVDDRRRQVTTLREKMRLAGQALDTTPLPQDAVRARSLQENLEKRLQDPPPQAVALGPLALEVTALEDFVREANQRAEDDRTRRTEAARVLREAAAKLEKALDLEVPEPGRADLAQRLTGLVSLAPIPTQDVLDDATKALEELTRLVAEANDLALLAREARAKRRLELIDLSLRKVADAAGTEVAALELAGTNLSNALPDPASTKDIETAEALLVTFDDLRNGLEKVVAERRLRVERGMRALARLVWDKDPFAPHAAAPPDRAKLLQEAMDKLALDNARLGRLGDAHLWGEVELGQFDKAIEALAQQVADLNEEVRKALEAVTQSAEAARKIVAAPKGHPFAQKQREAFETRIAEQEKAGTATMAAAPSAVQALGEVGRQAVLLSRGLAALEARIARVSITPTDALVTELASLTKARDAARKALEEVMPA